MNCHDGPSKIGGKRPRPRLQSYSSANDWLGNRPNCYYTALVKAFVIAIYLLDRLLGHLDWPQNPSLHITVSKIQMPLLPVRLNRSVSPLGVSKDSGSILSGENVGEKNKQIDEIHYKKTKQRIIDLPVIVRET